MALRNISLLFALIGAMFLSACASAPHDEAISTRDASVLELTRAIMALGPDVDPEEAARAARISYEYPLVLKEEWSVDTPAIFHNFLVNEGFRPKGLCYQWAYAMGDRLEQEQFRTIDIHQAIAEPRNLFRLQHSSAVVSAKGDTMAEGILVDPWRYGGYLYWSLVPDDPRYDWEEKDVVLARQAARRSGRKG